MKEKITIMQIIQFLVLFLAPIILVGVILYFRFRNVKKSSHISDLANATAAFGLISFLWIFMNMENIGWFMRNPKQSLFMGLVIVPILTIVFSPKISSKGVLVLLALLNIPIGTLFIIAAIMPGT